jgi:hypothetical protein
MELDRIRQHTPFPGEEEVDEMQELFHSYWNTVSPHHIYLIHKQWNQPPPSFPSCVQTWLGHELLSLYVKPTAIDDLVAMFRNLLIYQPTVHSQWKLAYSIRNGVVIQWVLLSRFCMSRTSVE